jgi:hypothetical protein
MAEEEEKSGSIPWLPLVTFVAVSSGIVLFFQQLTSSRPGGGDPRLTDNTFEEETIDARLWQDPIEVTTAELENQSGGKAHSVGDIQKLAIRKWFNRRRIAPIKAEGIYPLEEELDFAGQVNHVLILAAMIPGGPYVEDVERRLRSRRAVVEALGTAGYDPEKDHEIGYFCVPWIPLQADVASGVRMLESDRDQDEGGP